MKSPSFAEILNEKIESSKTKDARDHFIQGSTAKQNVPRPQFDSLELASFQSQLLEQRPRPYGKPSSFGLNHSPYNQYKASANRQENPSGGHFKGNTQKSTKPTTDASQEKETPRARTAPHKLTDLQTQSMSYFIAEKMFLMDDFTTEELKKAYKRLALKKHPDRQNGSNQFFVELQKHYKILSSVPKK